MRSEVVFVINITNGSGSKYYLIRQEATKIYFMFLLIRDIKIDYAIVRVPTFLLTFLMSKLVCALYILTCYTKEVISIKKRISSGNITNDIPLIFYYLQ